MFIVEKCRLSTLFSLAKAARWGAFVCGLASWPWNGQIGKQSSPFTAVKATTMESGKPVTGFEPATY
jgi:hypothetical protein